MTKLTDLGSLCRVVLDVRLGEWRWELLHLIAHADSHNLALLASVFPREAGFYQAWMELDEPTVTACETLRKLFFGW